MGAYVEALIAVGIDIAKAKAGADAITNMQKGMQDAAKAADDLQRRIAKVGEMGAKLREVGSVLAGLGGAMIAPFALAAQEYTRRFGQLESSSRNYLRAQERQANATAALGRVAAASLTPALNQVAAITEKIAAFAEAHPDLVAFGVGAGSALVAGGGALAIAGQAMDTASKAASLLTGAAPKLVELVGSIGKIGIPLAAFAGGLKLGEVIVNEYGKATGDSRLEHFKLTDALKTLREIVALLAIGITKVVEDAKVAAGDLGDAISGVGKLIENGVTDFVDKAVTGIQKFIVDISTVADAAKAGFNDMIGKIRDGFIDIINGIIAMINSVIEKLPGFLNVGKVGSIPKPQDTSGGGVNFSKTPAEQKAELDADYQARKKARDDAAAALGAQLAAQGDARRKARDANLATAAGNASNFAETGSLGADIDKLFGGIGNAINSVKKFVGDINLGIGAPTKNGVNGTNSSPEAVNAYIAYRKAAADSDRAYAQQVSDAKRQYDREEAKQRADLNKQVLQVQAQEEKALGESTKKYAEDRRKAQESYDSDSLQALKQFNAERAKTVETFNSQEKRINETANKDRERRAKDWEEQKRNFEISRDVAGFREAERQHQQEEEAAKDQEDTDRKNRLDDFNKQLSDQQQAFNDANAARDQQYRDNLDALKAQYDEEQRTTKDQFDQQIKDLRSNFDDQAAERAAAYRQQMSDMEDQHKREQDERDRAFAIQLASMQGGNAKLQALQAAGYEIQAQAFSTWVDKNLAKLEDSVRSQYGNISGRSNSDYARMLASAYPHAGGLDDVPYDNYLARLHKHERVERADGANSMPPVNITIVTSDVANKVYVDEAERRMVTAVRDLYSGKR